MQIGYVNSNNQQVFAECNEVILDEGAEIIYAVLSSGRSVSLRSKGYKLSDCYNNIITGRAITCMSDLLEDGATGISTEPTRVKGNENPWKKQPERVEAEVVNDVDSLAQKIDTTNVPAVAYSMLHEGVRSGVINESIFEKLLDKIDRKFGNNTTAKAKANSKAIYDAATTISEKALQAWSEVLKKASESKAPQTSADEYEF